MARELKKYKFQEEDVGKSFLVNTSYGKIIMWYHNYYEASYRLVGEVKDENGCGILEIELYDDNGFIDEEGNLIMIVGDLIEEYLIEEFNPQPRDGEEECEEYKELKRLISYSKEKLNGQLYLNFEDK